MNNLFDAALAKEYFEHRRLTSLPAKIDYMHRTGFKKPSTDFDDHMILTANRFEAMIMTMVDQEERGYD